MEEPARRRQEEATDRHDPLARARTLADTKPARQSVSRLWVLHHSDHSPETFSSPRSQNRVNPRILIYPKTGSMVQLRNVEIACPTRVSSFRSIRSLTIAWLGMRPLGHPCSRRALRCFHAFFVAMNSSVGSSASVAFSSLQ